MIVLYLQLVVSFLIQGEEDIPDVIGSHGLGDVIKRKHF